MSRAELVLALLASAGGHPFTPAQLQKTAFLITRNLPGLITEEPAFDFQPYDYGPYDKNVYVEAQRLRDGGQAEIVPSPWGRWVTYAASTDGVARGQQILSQLPATSRDYINSVAAWARSQSFNSLIKAIYDQYPAMRENSIFRDPS